MRYYYLTRGPYRVGGGARIEQELIDVDNFKTNQLIIIQSFKYKFQAFSNKIYNCEAYCQGVW